MTRQIGNYAIGDVVAESQRYTTYQARGQTDEPLLLRVLKVNIAQADTWLANLRYASHAQNLLRHARVLPIVDAAVQDGMLYYVTPFLEAQTLYDRLKQGKPLSIQQVQRLLHEIVDVLEAVHAKGIAYRSLNPDNILLHASGQAYFAELALEPYADSLDDTYYLAPELQQGLPASPLSDVYALGVCLYEMLTGKHYSDAWALWEEHFIEVLPSPLDAALRTAIDPIAQQRYAKSSLLMQAVEQAFQTLIQRDQLPVNKPVPLQMPQTAPAQQVVDEASSSFVEELPPAVTQPTHVRQDNALLILLMTILLAIVVIIGVGVFLVSNGFIELPTLGSMQAQPQPEVTLEAVPQPTPEPTSESAYFLETTAEATQKTQQPELNTPEATQAQQSTELSTPEATPEVLP